MFQKRQSKKVDKPAGRKPLVLLIDDEKQNLNVLQGVLKRAYRVICCGGGREALDLLADFKEKDEIKVIISDQRMPDMTGVEFFFKVRDVVPDALRIILTGYTDVGDIIDSINKANIYKFISKPFQPPDLLMTVMRACELFDMQLKLRVSEGLKREFINTVRHELRTPMNGIQGGIELLKINLQEPIDIDNIRGENLNILQESSMQMMRIVTSILDFSTYDASKKISDVALGCADLKTCFQELISGSFEEAQGKGLSVSYKGFSECFWVEIDLEKYRDILSHLLANAVKFTAKGSIRVTIECDVEGGTGTLKMRVKDSGIGVDPSMFESIFQIFVQGDGSFCRQYGGLGVGLAKAKNLVDMLNGRISLESKLGEGSEFSVELPVELSKDVPKCELIEPEVKKPVFQALPVIAVVEDNVINQLVLARILENLGCEVVIFCNGKEFVDWSTEHAADLVFMDCQMPVMNGYDATSETRAGHSLNHGVPIVACTSNVSEEDKQKCLTVGMDGYVAKPISAEGIKSVLYSQLGFDNPPQKGST